MLHVQIYGSILLLLGCVGGIESASTARTPSGTGGWVGQTTEPVPEKPGEAPTVPDIVPVPEVVEVPPPLPADAVQAPQLPAAADQARVPAPVQPNWYNLPIPRGTDPMLPGITLKSFPRSALSLGVGMDPLNEVIAKERLLPMQDFEYVDCESRETQLSMELCTNYRQLYEAAGVSISAEFSSFFVSGSAAFRESRSTALSDNSIAFVLSASNEYGRRRVRSLQLPPHVRQDIFDNPLSQTKYGSHVVAMERLECRAYAIINIDCSSSDQRKNVAVAVQGKAGFFFGSGSIKVNTSASLNELIERGKVRVQFSAAGGPGLQRLADLVQTITAKPPGNRDRGEQLLQAIGETLTTYVKESGRGSAVATEYYCVPIAALVGEGVSEQARKRAQKMPEALAQQAEIAAVLVEQQAALEHNLWVDDADSLLAKLPGFNTRQWLELLHRTRIRFALEHYLPHDCQWTPPKELEKCVIDPFEEYARLFWQRKLARPLAGVYCENRPQGPEIAFGGYAQTPAQVAELKAAFERSLAAQAQAEAPSSVVRIAQNRITILSSARVALQFRHIDNQAMVYLLPELATLNGGSNAGTDLASHAPIWDSGIVHNDPGLDYNVELTGRLHPGINNLLLRWWNQDTGPSAIAHLEFRVIVIEPDGQVRPISSQSNDGWMDLRIGSYRPVNINGGPGNSMLFEYIIEVNPIVVPQTP